jgi:hypothetical protein
VEEKIDKIIAISGELRSYLERIEDEIFSVDDDDEDDSDSSNALNIELLPTLDDIYEALRNALIGLRHSDQLKIAEAFEQAEATLAKTVHFEALILVSKFQKFQESWETPISEVIPEYAKHCFFFKEYGDLISNADNKPDINTLTIKNKEATDIIKYLDASRSELNKKEQINKNQKIDTKKTLLWTKIGIAIAAVLAFMALPQIQKWWDGLTFGGSAQAKSPTPQEAASSASQARTK